PAAPIAVPAPPPPRTFTVLGSGDGRLHEELWAQASSDATVRGPTGMDFWPIFASVKPVVSAADVAICRLETPLVGPDGPLRGYSGFRCGTPGEHGPARA